jgi:hypothetical protein
MHGRPLVRITRDVATRDIEEAERALVRRAFLDANRDVPPAIRERMKQAAQEFRFASRAPLFSRFLFSADGHLWVSPFLSGVGLPGPGVSLAPSVEQTWNVFSETGEWIASVTLPRRFVVHEVGANYVAGVRYDDDDVEQVVVIELKR